jgi:hypothetical protein
LNNPELFTSIGIADGTIFDHHSGRLTAVGNVKRDHDKTARNYVARFIAMGVKKIALLLHTRGL